MTDAPVFDRLFLSIGAMKAGTTWLWDALRQHPGLHILPEKEIHYFHARHVRPGLLADRARLRRAPGYLSFDPETITPGALRARLDWVSAWVDGPVDDAWFLRLSRARAQADWLCDFSNMAALIPAEGWRQIHARTGTLRVHYTLRAPISRLWSHLRFHLMLQGRLDDLDQWSTDEIFARLTAPESDFLAHTDYVANLGALRTALPEPCVRVAFFDEIVADPQAVHDAARAHLGLPPAPLPVRLLRQAVNRSPERPMPPGLAARLAPFAAAQCKGLRDMGLTLPRSWDAQA